MLGVERDNQLWMRGHIGTEDGKKGGRAPLGRDYFLANWQLEKNVYRGSFFKITLGPFVDTGRTYGSSTLRAPDKWLCDTGMQAKVRVLGSMAVVFSYGKDLRSGRNAFFATTSR